MDKFEALKQYFGYMEFRDGQEYVIDEIIKGKDVIAVMPTGAGKSLCFQIPALMSDGVTIVVSPLISLMKDQVMALKQAGVRGAYLNSSLSAAQYYKAVDNMRCGVYKIIYVAPERLLNENFLQAIADLQVDILAIDEAHCISQWGQDFRPSYTQIPEFLQRLKNRPVLAAFTATATQKVTEDIVAQLKLGDCSKLVTGFDRQNLYFEVQSPDNKQQALFKIVKKHRGESGIVYCNTRKNVEEVCQFLKDNLIKATRYHAGLFQEERIENQDEFIYDKCDVIVATNAFGMGIDKSNVRYVVHYNMPMDMESYYQEAGRAGRDGLAADCILLYGKKDVVTNEFLINKQCEQGDMPEKERQEVIKRGLKRLREITFYSTTTDCLRYRILTYFGEKPLGYCGNCGSCKLGHTEKDMTENAIQILHCIEQSGQRFGIAVMADVLRGNETDRVRQWNFQQQSSFASLCALTAKEISEEICHLIAVGALEQTKEQYPVLKLGESAREIMYGGRAVLIRKLNKPQREVTKRSQSTADSLSLHPQDIELFDKLRKLRAELAKNQGVPAFVVFSDATLRDMCAVLPKTQEELLRVSGVGQKKADAYGRKFLAIINSEKKKDS